MGGTMEGERLTWHPDSNVHDAGGTKVPRPAGRGGADAPVAVADTPPGAALRAVFAAGGHAASGFCLHPEGTRPPALPASGRAPWLCCMTSGTGGTPRLVRRSQRSWRLSFARNARMWSLGPEDRYAVPGALSHSLSLYGAMEALALGADLSLLAGLRPDRQAARMRDDGASVLYATPAQLRLLTRAAEETQLPALRLVLVGGAKLDAATRGALARLAPEAAVREFYGASETSFVTIADSDTPESSVGRPYPGVTLHVLDAHGQPVATGETGEIWVESPYLFSGYASGAPGDTRWRGGALTVGEFGHLDAEGFLFLAGRRGRMVTIADINVFPEEVENCLLALPGIARAAVLPVPDARRGHVLEAFVEAESGLPDDDILAHCRAALGPLKAPRRLHRPRGWPALASGKPDYAALAALLEGQGA